MTVSAEQLFDEIRYILENQPSPVKDADLILLLDVSEDVVDAISINFTGFGTFAIKTRYRPQRGSYSKETIETNLKQIFNTQIRLKQNHSYTFVMGDYADIPPIGKFIVNDLGSECYVVNLSSAGVATRMPDNREINDFLSKQVGFTRHSLDVVTLKIPDDIRNDERRQFVERAFITVYDVGIDVNIGDRIGEEVHLYAPVVNKPLYIFFREMPSVGLHPNNVYMYEVIPTEREFYALVIFNGETWTIEWDGAREIKRREQMSDLPGDIQRRWRVQLDTVLPKVLFVIEGSLGMRRLLARLDNTEAMSEMDTETDFDLVQQFVKWMIGTLSISEAQYALMFYNDYHQEQRIPYEFRDRQYNPERYSVNSEDEILTYIPYQSTSNTPVFADARRILELIEQDFAERQTITSDWYKSMEYAMHQINEIDWQGANHLIIWIGQSSPHHTDHDMNDPKNYIGFSSPYRFMDELEESLQNRLFKYPRHVAFFLSKDIPLDTLRREARNYWKRIGQDRYTFDIKLAQSEDLNNSLIEGDVYDLLSDISRDLLTVEIITSKTGQNIDLPFDYLHSNIQIRPIDQTSSE